MAIALLLLSGTAIILWLHFLWSRRHFYKVAWQLPGPWGLPLIGLGIQMRNPSTFLQYMKRKAAHYRSPLISWMGTDCFLYVNDPETVEAIFNSPYCTNKADIYRVLSSSIGDGLFTSSSPRWNKHRRLINPAFSRQILQNFLPIFNAEAEVLLAKLATASDAGHKLEIYEMLKRSVLEIACQTTMGKKMNFQNDGATAIFDAYNNLTEIYVRRILSPWLHPDCLYRCSTLYKRQQQYIGTLYGLIEKLLQPQLKAADVQEATVDNNDDDEAGMFATKSKFIFVEQMRQYVKKGQFTWEDVRDEANVMIAASFETTSTAIYFVCLCLAMHPECQDKLYDELQQVLSDSNNNNFALSPDQLESLKYTEMAINEAMRLFAPVPMVLRSVVSDFMLDTGALDRQVLIPRGTQVGIDIYNMQRSETVWGPHAHEFRPELHFGSQATGQQPHPFAFVPFTKGLRMCIGYRYAQMLMKVFVVQIFRHYRLHTDAKLQDIQPKGTISLKLQDYPLCEFHRR